MSRTRAELLSTVRPGDVLYGVSGGGSDKLLLGFERTKRGFLARHITSQTWAEFDPDGVTYHVTGGGSCKIMSIAPLPPADYATAIALDTKIRERMGRRGLELTRAEIDLLGSFAAYFRAHPLPEN